MNGPGKDYVFDLDGTLVDSLPGIGSALGAAFASIGRTLPAANLRHAIGPPIPVIARRLDPALTDAQALAIERAYRPLYDERHWLETTLFDGVPETLRSLRQAGHRLFVATNKPRIPATRILKHFGLDDLFVEIRTRDAATPPYPSKAAMLATLVDRHACHPDQCVMVGDTAEDAEAAQANGVPFVFAAYGYGSYPSASRILARFSDLLDNQGIPT